MANHDSTIPISAELAITDAPETAFNRFDYEAFLAKKLAAAPSSGIEVDASSIHPSLHEFQKDLVRWSLRKGRAAIFANTGLGKSRMQLEWARLTGERVLILAPLAVARQTVKEAAILGIELVYARSMQDAGPLTITNYEMADKFDASQFGAVVLDESSILKSHDGKTRARLIEQFSETPYRLCCTATPAPNDIAELANHAEFLGILSRVEMLSMFFVHDDAGWRLKGHAREPFYKWLASWGMSLQMPSDLGYPDDGYVLPELTISPVIIQTDYTPPGQLFATTLKGVGDRANVRKSTVDERVAAAIDLIRSQPGEKWLIWCGLNSESDAIARALPGSVNVQGSDSRERKEDAVLWFSGELCICNSPLFPERRAQWASETIQTIKKTTTEPIVNDDLPSRSPINRIMQTNARNTCAGITNGIPNDSEERQNSKNGSTPPAAQNTPPIPPTGSSKRKPSKNGNLPIQTNGLLSGFDNMDSQSINTARYSNSKTEDARFADENLGERSTLPNDCTLTIATQREESEDSFALPAISPSANSMMTPKCSNEPQCTCGHQSGRRVLISKTSIFGFGLNLQHCARMIFVGMGDSYESYYQAIRRCWRYGQARPVEAYVVLTDIEEPIYFNVLRKEVDATAMAAELVKHVANYERAEIGHASQTAPYLPTVPMTLPRWIGAHAA